MGPPPSKSSVTRRLPTLSAGNIEYNAPQSRSVTVLGSEFIPEIESGEAITHFADSNLTSGFGNTVLLAHVDLPVGAVVQGMDVYINDQTTVRGLNIQLRRRALDTGENIDSQLVANFTSTNSSVRNPTQPGSAVIFGAQDVRSIDAFFLDARALGGWTFDEVLAIRGVRVNYTVPAPD